MSGPTNEDISFENISWISEGSNLEGTFYFDQICRIHGKIKGEINTPPGGTVILTETALFEGKFTGGTLIINGYFQGKIKASEKLVIEKNGRFVGEAESTSFRVERGAVVKGTIRTSLPTHPEN
jgi:cytoskeletal protein CcmA (bactofilin family)